MNNPEFTINLSDRTPNGSISTSDLQKAKTLLSMRGSGLVLLPSDTCYSLAALATSKDIYKAINQILDREDMPISIAFPNFMTVEKYVNMHFLTATLLEKFTPGPITVVCEANSKIPSEFSEEVIRSKDGTVGVRIPDSIIEREIASCNIYPIITTVAVRDEQNTIIQNFNKAKERVQKGIEELDQSISWAAIEGSNFFYQHSTVVRVNEVTKKIQLLREGEIHYNKIYQLSKNYPIWGFED